MAAYSDSISEKQIINMYRPLLVKKIIFKQVVPWLIQAGLMQNANEYDAVSPFLDRLIEKNHPGWFASFTTALKKAGYRYLSHLLNGYTDLKDDSFAQNLINMFLPQLIESIDCGALLSHLKQKCCLTTHDMEMIRAKQRSDGDTVAACDMIQVHLASKNKHWFAKFIMCLNGVPQYKNLVDLIDPKLTTARNEEQAEEMLNKLQRSQGSRSTTTSGRQPSDRQPEGAAAVAKPAGSASLSRDHTDGAAALARPTRGKVLPASVAVGKTSAVRTKGPSCPPKTGVPVMMPGSEYKPALPNPTKEGSIGKGISTSATVTPSAVGSPGAVKPCSLCKRERETFPCSVCDRKVVCQRCGICKKCKRS